MINSVKLEKNITKELISLKRKIKRYSTFSIICRCHATVLVSSNTDNKTKLHSPAKQLSFLIGLMLSTNEPLKPKHLDESKWNDLLNILNKLFNNYWLLYCPEQNTKREDLLKEWLGSRQIALYTFFNDYNTDSFESVEQLKDRILRYLVPFEEIVTKKMGISLTKSLEICDFITKHNQDTINQIRLLRLKEDDFRQKIVSKLENIDWQTEYIQEEVQEEAYYEIAKKIAKKTNEWGIIDTNFLKGTFKEYGEIYCENFIIERGHGDDIKYPTDISIYETKPLIKLDENRSLCPSANSLYLALIKIGEKIILESDNKSEYLKARDSSL